MPRVHNFNAGPAALPLPALERAQRELLDHDGTGMSIIEHSHRGKAFEAVHNEAISLLRQLLDVPDDYHVLFQYGGASHQFAVVPLNLLHAGRSADYIITGGWSEKAYQEAERIGTVRVAGTTEVDKRYTRIPRQEELTLDPNAAYVHMTTNNTLFGTQWHWLPETGDVPLVADMSSDFLWRRIDVRRFGLIYAGAQKNIGPSGLTVVLARKDLVDGGRKDIPTIFRYATHATNNSLYNTPPTFAIYLVRNVLAYTVETGGLDEVERRNRRKAELLYGTIDERPDFFRAPVEAASRSFMNVVFRLPSEELEKRFIAEAAREGMVGLAGHRSTGGIRVSLYNAVEVASVEFLVSFMRAFASRG
ncbi:3-phosphoserine/phosphohydroxythreonine transaminase [Chondromyces apiculatus]|uniref:Phosphoserine aminotransferase n=1 Tax=Chondromyces apiculatus DSM 436 TaxID=1192034 RepID=A0A017T7R3_9BACT|nr:3-phosphoserine/phosphohydroxythreonine transaminase [Chondromyces apiculatus]EYF05313.1 Phosphoserine aminotransferase [Chondromyces apiculatus DSM 436]